MLKRLFDCCHTGRSCPKKCKTDREEVISTTRYHVIGLAFSIKATEPTMFGSDASIA